MAKENNMTKNDLLGFLENSNLKNIKETREVYPRCYSQVEDLLIALPNDEKIDNLPKLEKLIESVKLRQYEGIDKKLESFVEELRSWLGICANVSGAVARHEHKRRTGFGIFFGGIIIIAAVAAIFTVLDFAGLIDYGEKVAALIGLFDLLFGLAFFVYEKHSDHKKKQAIFSGRAEFDRIAGSDISMDCTQPSFYFGIRDTKISTKIGNFFRGWFNRYGDDNSEHDDSKRSVKAKSIKNLDMSTNKEIHNHYDGARK